MTLIPLLLSCVLSWSPTIDGQRIALDALQSPPYWLGVSIPDGQYVAIQAIVDGQTVLAVNQGTDWYLTRIESPQPVYFYADGKYSGMIIPEPGTLVLFLTGMFYEKRFYARKHVQRK